MLGRFTKASLPPLENAWTCTPTLIEPVVISLITSFNVLVGVKLKSTFTHSPGLTPS